MSLKVKSRDLFLSLQNKICSALEAQDGVSKFREDKWEREDKITSSPGGGGLSKIISKGNIFEQGGVNFSEVYGELPDIMKKKFNLKDSNSGFYATGISLVIHPYSPQVPTVHANFRYFELDNIAWFGGGADLTPYVLYEEDAIHFHQVLKQSCDKISDSYYADFKKECDSYFFIPHRNETRGVGGIFYDYLGKDDPSKLEEYFNLSYEVGNSFIDSYIPIVEKRKELSWTERQKEFQLLRRGRYVEFNLVYDRGTQFGLATGGRTESILMSLPPNVTWQYESELASTSEETKLMEILKSPRDWV